MKVSALSLILNFVILLFVVRISYEKINELLIKKRLIKKEHEGKDFTYVFWDSVLGIETWDKKLAVKPSWLDYTITYILLILPILLIVPINKIIR